MNKEVRFTGFTTVPSDYECPDGQLAQSLNLLNETGSMQPIFSPKVLLSLDAGSKIIFVHNTSAYKHYIIMSADGSLKWVVTSGGQIKDLRASHYETVSHVDAIGNTLLVFTSTAIIYYLWKDNDYKELGDALPDIQISFGLTGRPRLYSVSDDSKSTFTISFDGIAENDINGTFSETNKTKITSQVMAKVNKFIAQQTVNKGRFCFPFLVRYALRLYDGTLTGHSAPILMNPSTVTCPVVIWKHVKGKKSYTEAELDIMLVAATLDYQVINNSGCIHLDDWSDIVKGVEVYISKPIYTFDQNGECSSFADSDNFETKFIGRLYNKPTRPGGDAFGSSIEEDRILGPFGEGQTLDFLNWYCEWEYSKIYALYFSTDRTYPSKTLHLPEFTDNKVAETIRNTSNFYKLHDLDISELKASVSSRTPIVVEDEYLQSLVARETLTDDYLSHDKLRASQSFGYNSRLNLSGVKRKLFDGFYMPSLLAYKNKDFNWSGNKNKTYLKITDGDFGGHNYTVMVYIKENNQDYTVSSQFFGFLGMGFSLGRLFSEELTYTNLVTGEERVAREKHSWGCYFFYPNVNAYRMVIQDDRMVDDGNGGFKYPRLIIDLQAHDFLNGAFAVLDYEHVVLDNYDSAKIPAIDYNPDIEQNVVDVPNKIYTSEVNNPFFFPVTGINTVGTGRILGICSAAKALSQGQFGQFPLYAFTDEGVWALEVSSSGGFSAKQPITRDVCRSAESITQIDSAVLFATDRGIMLISGSQTQCISDVLNSPDYFDFTSLPGLCAKFPEFRYPDCLFIDYIKDCRMSYDYVNQRIILFNPDKRYAYVYSMKTKLWGIQECTLTSVINSYPDALAMAKGEEENYLVDLSHTDAETVRSLLVSRPLKFDSPDVLKTLTTTIQRGMLSRHSEDVATILYGTRDYISWHLIGSSCGLSLRSFRGTPYKAFRIVSVATMRKGNTIAGCSFDVIPRMTNRLR
ncbi:MAG: hypothetical protein HDS10_01235 [Bacteroides sp.]|nr:hypothetical protein [Bacteroides sp.]